MAAGLPLKHVARDLGVSVSIVCEWEHGHRFPSISHLEEISRYVGLPACCLLFHGHGHCPHSRVAVNGPADTTVKVGLITGRHQVLGHRERHHAG